MKPMYVLLKNERTNILRLFVRTFLMKLAPGLRKTFLPTEYTHVVNLHNFIKLMSTSDELTLRNIAMFIYYAFERRKEMIQTEVVHQ